MYHTARANPASKGGDLATLTRRMHVRKSLVSYPLDIDAFVAIVFAHRKKVHSNFQCRVCAALIFSYKIGSVA